MLAHRHLVLDRRPGASGEPGKVMDSGSPGMGRIHVRLRLLLTSERTPFCPYGASAGRLDLRLGDPGETALHS